MKHERFPLLENGIIQIPRSHERCAEDEERASRGGLFGHGQQRKPRTSSCSGRTESQSRLLRCDAEQFSGMQTRVCERVSQSPVSVRTDRCRIRDAQNFWFELDSNFARFSETQLDLNSYLLPDQSQDRIVNFPRMNVDFCLFALMNCINLGQAGFAMRHNLLMTKFNAITLFFFFLLYYTPKHFFVFLSHVCPTVIRCGSLSIDTIHKFDMFASQFDVWFWIQLCAVFFIVPLGLDVRHTKS